MIGLDRKTRKRAELIEKLAAKAVLFPEPAEQLEPRIASLLAEWAALVPVADAYQAFMARVSEQVRRLEDEDDEHAAEMLLLL